MAIATKNVEDLRQEINKLNDYELRLFILYCTARNRVPHITQLQRWDKETRAHIKKLVNNIQIESRQTPGQPNG